jgi:hypothetical protein
MTFSPNSLACEPNKAITLIGAKQVRDRRLLCGYAVGNYFAPTYRRVHCPNVLWSDLDPAKSLRIERGIYAEKRASGKRDKGQRPSSCEA